MTQYERGVDVERKIEHKFEFMGKSVTRSAGSHKEADLVVSDWEQVMYLNVKRHEGLRSKDEEKRLLEMPRPKYTSVWTGFLRKTAKRIYIILVNLENGIEWILEPLTKEQEKKYQEMKKQKIEARKSTNVRLLSGVQQTKTTKRSKS